MCSYLNRFMKNILPKVLLTPINCLFNVKRSRNYDLKLNRGRSNKVGTYTDPILKKGEGRVITLFFIFKGLDAFLDSIIYSQKSRFNLMILKAYFDVCT